jgi:predicted ATP-grasp superfamily ATP-dependent carboligase
MALSLTNSKDIVANSVTVVKGNRAIDLLETIDAVTGLAPDTLNSLEKLAKAMNDDPVFFTALSSAIDNKADKSTTYTRLVTDDLLDAKVDDTELADYALKTYVTTAVGTRQATLSNGTEVTNSKTILFGNIIKNIVPGTNITL